MSPEPKAGTMLPDWLPLPSGLLPEAPSPSTLLITVLVLAGAYVLGQALYLATLHPLAAIPGPRLCAMTRLPYWYHSFRGRDVQWLHGLHGRYGPQIRYSPSDVSHTAAAAWSDIYDPRKGLGENPKTTDFNLQPVNGVPALLTADLDHHTRVRRIFSPAFSERAIKSQEPIFQQFTHLLIAKLRELSKDGSPIEMTRILNFATFDIMGELCFGRPLGLLEKNEFNPWVKSVFSSIRMMPYVSFISYYPLLQAIFTRFEPKSLHEMRVNHSQYSADRVDRRMREGDAGKPDLWALLEAAQDTADTTLSREEMHSNGELFMLAGTETSATVLSGALFFLTTNPPTLARLTSEIRGAFRRPSDITFQAVASLPYLQACIRETMRLYPPVAVGVPRVIPAGGREIAGRWLPQGTRASVHHYSASRAAANFRHPDAFAPERWTPEGAAGEYADDARDASAPFSVGPRNCIGQNVAMHEMRLLLASLIFNFYFELCDESRDWIDQRAFALWEKKELRCRVRPVDAM